MSAPTAFLFGFLTAALVCAVLAIWYYVRARRRVNSIKRAIIQYQQAKSVVGSAIEEAYKSNP